MNALVELMGSLSNVRFATVSDRFIAELEKYKTGVPVKDKDRELRMEMLIRGMRYLNLKASLPLSLSFLFMSQGRHGGRGVIRSKSSSKLTPLILSTAVSRRLFGRDGRFSAELRGILQDG